MPTSTRRQAQAQFPRTRLGQQQPRDPHLPTEEFASYPSEDPINGHEYHAHDDGAEEDEDEHLEGLEGDEEDSNETHVEDFEPEPFPPPGLKEISSLASWTVSSAKPGNGVAALRSLDTAQFWQSDGPQPHLLSIHFFKLVSIVYMRIFLDFENDESYTPTKIQFLAGMGEHDIQEFAEMTFEQPTGWIDVDFTNIGPIDNDDVVVDDHGNRSIDWSRRPVLRAFLVQVKILENHQNGKDTHLRAVQLFARDDSNPPRRTAQLAKVLPSRAKARTAEPNNITLASWMQDPDLR